MGLFVSLSVSTHSIAQAIKVEITEENGNYELLRGGKPYTVNGVGFVDADLARVAKYGANSIRTWSIDNNAMPTKELLDKAHALGISVSLCLPFGKERYGFDYNDTTAVEKLIAKSRASVMKYKDHPALLTWIIGNEVNFHYTNPKVFEAVNKVSVMIKEIDPNHPTTTALAGFDKKAINDIEARAPDLDFISFQMYGELLELPELIAEIGFEKPYFVTEWGAIGHWEVNKTPWGAPIENTSTEKAENYFRSYHEVLKPYANKAIGNYVFLWGQKQEKTPTWYGMFLPTGEVTEPVDVMHEIWMGKKRDNTAPQVSPITINGRTAFDDVKLSAGTPFNAVMGVTEPENDSVSIMWEIRKETTSKAVGGDAEYLPQHIETEIRTISLGSALIEAPENTGAYRLFAYVYDEFGNAGHANIPFYVE